MRAFERLVGMTTAACFCLAAGFAHAASSKGTRFWNLTTATIAELKLAPTGTSNFGPNQCENDKDGTVSPNERLKVTKVASGAYDVKLMDANGRVCLIHNIKVEAEQVFSLEDADLKDCKPK